MAATIDSPTVKSDVTEKTFTKYNSTQAKTYGEYRRNYHTSVYDFVLEHHKNTGGKFETVLDVGCGPGLVTRSVAPHFTNAIGIDPSPALLDVAKADPTTPPNTTYHASSASTFSPSPIAPNSISLITVGNAAHWFPSMAEFYHMASTALVPGGTLAMWTSGDMRASPSMPNSAAIQEAMDHHIEVALAPYTTSGNLIVRSGYRDLPLPWSASDSGTALPNEFDEASYVRREWQPTEQFFTLAPGEEQGLPLPLLDKMLRTGSATARWAEANPADVGTERDVIKVLLGKIGALLREGGMKEGEERVSGSAGGVVILIKKKAE